MIVLVFINFKLPDLKCTPEGELISRGPDLIITTPQRDHFPFWLEISLCFAHKETGTPQTIQPHNFGYKEFL